MDGLEGTYKLIVTDTDFPIKGLEGMEDIFEGTNPGEQGHIRHPALGSHFHLYPGSGIPARFKASGISFCHSV